MIKPSLLSFFALSIAVAATPAAAQRKVQCWTDKDGQRMCGDRVPPEYADKEREVINKHGYVVEKKGGIKSQEEIEAEKRRIREAEEAQKRAEYDRALIQTYRSVKDLEVMRDDRLASLDSRIRITEKNLADNEKVLADLKEREESLKAQNKPVDAKLASQIKQYKRSLKDNKKALATFNNERTQTLTKFNEDIVRFAELKGLPPPTLPAAPEATPVSTAAPGVAPAAPAPSPSATPAPAAPPAEAN